MRRRQLRAREVESDPAPPSTSLLLALRSHFHLPPLVPIMDKPLRPRWLTYIPCSPNPPRAPSISPRYTSVLALFSARVRLMSLLRELEHPSHSSAGFAGHRGCRKPGDTLIAGSRWRSGQGSSTAKIAVLAWYSGGRGAVKRDLREYATTRRGTRSHSTRQVSLRPPTPSTLAGRNSRRRPVPVCTNPGHWVAATVTTAGIHSLANLSFRCVEHVLSLGQRKNSSDYPDVMIHGDAARILDADHSRTSGAQCPDAAAAGSSVGKSGYFTFPRGTGTGTGTGSVQFF